jgi:hypothetical protein
MQVNMWAPPRKAMQSDKVNLSRHLHTQGPRQFAVAADRRRYVGFEVVSGG